MIEQKILGSYPFWKRKVQLPKQDKESKPQPGQTSDKQKPSVPCKDKNRENTLFLKQFSRVLKMVINDPNTLFGRRQLLKKLLALPEELLAAAGELRNS